MRLAGVCAGFLLLVPCVAWAADASPSLANGAPTATFGIGSIDWATDNTDAAFDAFRYFRQHPITINGQKARVALTDFPTDGDYQLSGKLTGYTEVWHDSFPQTMNDGMLWTALLAPCLAFGFLVPGAIIGITELVIVGVAILGATVLAEITMFALREIVGARSNVLDSNVGGEFTLRKGGKKIADLKVPAIKFQVRGGEDLDSFASRDKALEPLMSKVGTWVSVQIPQGPAR